jgi:hypothetical protein
MARKGSRSWLYTAGPSLTPRGPFRTPTISRYPARIAPPRNNRFLTTCSKPRSRKVPGLRAFRELDREDDRIRLPPAVWQRVHRERLAIEKLAEHFPTADGIVAEAGFNVEGEGSDLFHGGQANDSSPSSSAASTSSSKRSSAPWADRGRPNKMANSAICALLARARSSKERKPHIQAIRRIE